MKSGFLLLTAYLLCACQSLPSDDPSSIFFSLPESATVTLNKSLAISELHTHALIQSGRQISLNERNRYAINCRLELRDFGPRNIEPETFRISRIEDGSEWVSYAAIMRFYTELYLQSDSATDVIMLSCQQWGGVNDRNFPVAAMQQALGDYFTFNY